MSQLPSLFDRFVYRDVPGARKSGETSSRYGRMWRRTVFSVAAVSIIPLVSITLINYVLYQRSFQQELTQPILRIASITRNSVSFFLEERIAASRYILSRESLDDLNDPDKLARIFRRMRNSFGGIVDIGIIDGQGIMRNYAGPFELTGKSYKNQPWFNELLVRDVVVSDVFLGHRNTPHFIVAIKREGEDGRVAIFRATIDSAVLKRLIRSSLVREKSDKLIINQEGITQTRSLLFGPPLSKFEINAPLFNDTADVLDDVDIGGEHYLMGHTRIPDSPFTFVVLVRDRELRAGWLAYKGEMITFVSLSVLAILLLIMWITTSWVTRIRDSDLRREASLHSIEHTNKMASIGRLAAGVAHEINNPMAIINERAGLIKDLIAMQDRDLDRDKLARQVTSIIDSVKRCSDITHRLLGFARRMDIQHEPVAVDALIREVLGFLEMETSYRGVDIQLEVSEALPTVYSDKGQLQQLFLNIINNALDAMDRGGQMRLRVSDKPPNAVEVTIADNGVGIPQADLERIFEPFFSTKKGKGTGLGLSICYGIVQKLGGKMKVSSEVGHGTQFTITLPTSRET